MDESIVLKQHKIDRVYGQEWTMKTMKKKLRIVIVRIDGNEMEFDIIGLPPALVNAFRRIMLADVPTMAIEKVHIFTNTSILQDEFLAHRIGLIPLMADPRLFDLKYDENSDYGEHDSLEFELKIKCSFNNESNTDSSRADDIYKNNNVYSRHIKWVPTGSQSEIHKPERIGPLHDDILITKLRPGHELDMKLIAVKGTGADHAKFSPVATAWYRLLPEIKLVKEVEGEAAERLQSCFCPGVIDIKKSRDRRVAVVNCARYDISSRNVLRHEDLRDAVVMSKVPDHFIFGIESVGALPPDEIFKESVKILKNKCRNLLDELACF